MVLHSFCGLSLVHGLSQGHHFDDQNLAQEKNELGFQDTILSFANAHAKRGKKKGDLSRKRKGEGVTKRPARIKDRSKCIYGSSLTRESSSHCRFECSRGF